MMHRQPWIRSASFDGVLILLPPFAALAAVALLPDRLRTGASVPLVAWVVLVLCIDVAHVYSTLFRTYLDRSRRKEFRSLLIWAPVCCWLAGVGIYATGGAGWFWRLLAYAAVWHFVRQQYGFLRIYNRFETSAQYRRLDEVLIYAATLYPLAWWHLSSPRAFAWFVAGDFVQVDWPFGRQLLTATYAILWLAYLYKEARLATSGVFNWPRNLLLGGTALSWLVGIVWFNADLVFTLLNVVAHGIPYMALVWARRTAEQSPVRRRSPVLTIAGFLAIIVALAWLEEGIWDGIVWREHAELFEGFHWLPQLTHSPLLMWVVPLLAVPQATHYLLDGFIWKRPVRL